MLARSSHAVAVQNTSRRSAISRMPRNPALRRACDEDRSAYQTKPGKYRGEAKRSRVRLIKATVSGLVQLDQTAADRTPTVDLMLDIGGIPPPDGPRHSLGVLGDPARHPHQPLPVVEE